ncbi:hypothetical protein pclt_cds_674 [Pandoravirus celtis]|nr:hypothetical protein pclt_cds_674 [Pandoravirus celtis]
MTEIVEGSVIKDDQGFDVAVFRIRHGRALYVWVEENGTNPCLTYVATRTTQNLFGRAVTKEVDKDKYDKWASSIKKLMTKAFGKPPSGRIRYSVIDYTDGTKSSDPINLRNPSDTGRRPVVQLTKSKDGWALYAEITHTDEVETNGRSDVLIETPVGFKGPDGCVNCDTIIALGDVHDKPSPHVLPEEFMRKVVTAIIRNFEL